MNNSVEEITTPQEPDEQIEITEEKRRDPAIPPTINTPSSSCENLPIVKSKFNFNNIPAELKELNQWVLWKIDPKIDKKTGKQKIEDGSLKWTKPPYSMAGYKVGIDNLDNCYTFKDAQRVYYAKKNSKNAFSGIGFVFSKSDNYVGIDIDNCIDSQGNISEDARQWIEKFSSYTEYSQSRTGLHIIVKGSLPTSGTKSGNYEIYTDGRYFAITGDLLRDDTGINDNCQSAIDEFYQKVKPAPVTKTIKALSPSPVNYNHDRDVMECLRNSSNWGDIETLLNGGWLPRNKSQSEADGSLCFLLAFHTKDPGEIESIIRSHPVYREKWEREDYRTKTINGALETVTGECKRCNPDPYTTLNITKPVTGLDIKEPVENIDYNKLPQQKKKNWEPLISISLKDFRCKKFPPVKFLVQDILPEGLSILAGAPKTGKTFLALNMALSIAQGEKTMAHLSTEKTGVAYLSIDEGDRSLHSKFLSICEGQNLTSTPDNFNLIFNVNRLTEGGTEQIIDYIDNNPEVKFIVIDTLGKIRKPCMRGNAYEMDVQSIGGLSDICKDKGVSILLLHHLKKGYSEDYVENLSGSMGISGTVDTILALSRKRGEGEGYLKVTGRLIKEEKDLAIKFNKDLLSWEILGDAEIYKQTEARRKIIEVLTEGENMPLSNKEIAASLNAKFDNIRQLTIKMSKSGVLLAINSSKGENKYVINPTFNLNNIDYTDNSNNSDYTNYSDYSKTSSSSSPVNTPPVTGVIGDHLSDYSKKDNDTNENKRGVIGVIDVIDLVKKEEIREDNNKSLTGVKKQISLDEAEEIRLEENLKKAEEKKYNTCSNFIPERNECYHKPNTSLEYLIKSCSYCSSYRKNNGYSVVKEAEPEPDELEENF